MYKYSKLLFSDLGYVVHNAFQHLKIYFSNLRMNHHKRLVERYMYWWIKPKVAFNILRVRIMC